MRRADPAISRDRYERETAEMKRSDAIIKKSRAADKLEKENKARRDKLRKERQAKKPKRGAIDMQKLREDARARRVPISERTRTVQERGEEIAAEIEAGTFAKPDMIKGRAASGMFTDLTIIGGKMVVKGSLAAKSAEEAVPHNWEQRQQPSRPLKVLHD